MTSIRPQLASDIAEGQTPTESQLSAEQLKSLAKITRSQLLEDIGSGMLSQENLADEQF